MGVRLGLGGAVIPLLKAEIQTWRSVQARAEETVGDRAAAPQLLRDALDALSAQFRCLALSQSSDHRPIVVTLEDRGEAEPLREEVRRRLSMGGRGEVEPLREEVRRRLSMGDRGEVEPLREELRRLSLAAGEAGREAPSAAAREPPPAAKAPQEAGAREMDGWGMF